MYVVHFSPWQRSSCSLYGVSIKYAGAASRYGTLHPIMATVDVRSYQQIALDILFFYALEMNSKCKYPPPPSKLGYKTIASVNH